jgi:hypothetical protein
MAARTKMRAAGGAGGMGLDPSILEFFDSVTGSGAVNMNIVYPKAQDLRHSGTEFLGLLAKLGDSAEMKRIRPAAAAELTALAGKFEREFDGNFCTPVDIDIGMFASTPNTKDFRAEFGALYRKMKDCEILSTALLMTSEMVPLRHAVEKDPKVKLEAAIAQMPADVGDMCPFAVGSMQMVKNEATSLLSMHQHDAAAAEKVWRTLRKVLLLGLQLYTTLEQPDFDSDAIAEAVASSLGRCSSALHGCDAGFALIKNSTGLFKDNASKYQRDIERTGNPMTLFSSYCGDLEAYAQGEMNNGSKRARKTKIDLMRIMNYITRTTAKMQGAMGSSPGGRLLNVISKQVSKASDKLEADIANEVAADEGHDDASADESVRRFRDTIRQAKAKDEAKMTEQAAKIIASREDAVILVGGSASGATPPPNAPWNIDDALAFIDGPGPNPQAAADKARRKREKRERRKNAPAS